MTGAVGQPVQRVDGRLKVTGEALFTADVRLPSGLAHAAMVGSTIARGRVVAIEVSATRQVPGVLAVFTHANAPRLAYQPWPGDRPTSEPDAGTAERVLQTDRILHQGQCVALVVANTPEQAAHAASLVRVAYAVASDIETSFGDALAAGRGAPPSAAGESGTTRGDPDRALASAALRIDAEYRIGRIYHQPIELFATVAVWEGDRLTIWDKSQWPVNHQRRMALVFGIPEDHVRVIAPYVGGGFGAAGRAWPHVELTAMAARAVGRPVKLVLTRRQQAHGTGFRPQSIQRIALGADRDGHLVALGHEATHETSRYEEYTEELVETSAHLHACPNVRTRSTLVALDTNTPTSMRAPGYESGLLALECGLDELASALALDPLELRLRNYAERDDAQDRPYSTKALRECYRAGAERFGWARRSPAPRSMRDGRWLVGWGMSAAHFPTNRQPASAHARLEPDGSLTVRSSTTDMGPGTYTSLAQVAADALGVSIERVRVELGDSRLPRAPIHSGSMTTASVGSAVHAACRALRRKITVMVLEDPASPLRGLAPERIAVGNGHIFPAGHPARGEGYGDILQRHGGISVEAEVESKPGPESERYSMHGFGAVFAEVAVDPDLLALRVRRIVGAYDIGRVLNPRLARSQAIGGMTMGLGMALLESAAVDLRDGRVGNANLADYLVPVHADVPGGAALEAIFVGEPDRHANPLGVKGFGELAMSGTAPAIVNAVFHAIGSRVRELPIAIERLLPPWAEPR